MQLPVVQLRHTLGSFSLTRERTVAVAVLGSALVLGSAIRIWLSLNDDGIYWPDEIYQSLEPAHRLVFGYGIVPWEFIDGARSWAFPAFVAGLLEIGRLLGDDARAYLSLTRLAFSAIGIATAVGSYRLARVHGAAELPAACGAAVIALSAPMIYFAPRALSETASALPVVFGFSLALSPNAGRWQRVLGASLLGLAVLLRLQNAIFCLGLVAIFAGRRQVRSTVESAIVLGVWAMLYGLLDLLTWGGWFHSAFTYVRATLSPEWYEWWRTHPVGLEPPDYFVRVIWSSMPAVALVTAALSLAAARRATGLLFAALAFSIFHTAFPHKELRYIVPVLPLFAALAAIGLDEIAARAKRWSNESGSDVTWVAPTLSVVLVASVALSAAGFHDLTFRQMGEFGPRNAAGSAYDDPGSLNRLVLAAGKQADLCGLKLETGHHLDISGGYSYLHRPVPFYPTGGPPLESGYFNYVIAFHAADMPGEIRSLDGQMALLRVRASCVPDLHYSWGLQ